MELSKAAIAFLLMTTPAWGLCIPRDELTQKLSGQYEEHVSERGLASTGQLVELFTSQDGRTWTLVITSPDGTSCLMAVGEYWLDSPVVPANET